MIFFKTGTYCVFRVSVFKLVHMCVVLLFFYFILFCIVFILRDRIAKSELEKSKLIYFLIQTKIKYIAYLPLRIIEIYHHKEFSYKCLFLKNLFKKL